MQIVSNEDNLHEMSNPVFLGKKGKKNVITVFVCWISPESDKAKIQISAMVYLLLHKIIQFKTLPTIRWMEIDFIMT